MFKYVRAYSFGDAATYLGQNGEITADDDGNLFSHDGITPGGMSMPKTVNYTLTRNQLLTCLDTPIEIIPAPGIGYAIAPFCVATSSRISSTFSGGSNAGLYYLAGMLSITVDPFAVITNGRNTFTVSNLASPNDAASFKMDNSSVVFTASANFTGGAGSSALITVVYSIVPLAQSGAGDF